MLPPPRVMSAAETLRALVQRGDVRLPVMPSVMVRLQALLEDVDRADARSVAAIVRTEPALAALTLAGCASYHLGENEDIPCHVADIPGI